MTTATFGGYTTTGTPLLDAIRERGWPDEASTFGKKHFPGIAEAIEYHFTFDNGLGATVVGPDPFGHGTYEVVLTTDGGKPVHAANLLDEHNGVGASCKSADEVGQILSRIERAKGKVVEVKVETDQAKISTTIKEANAVANDQTATVADVDKALEDLFAVIDKHGSPFFKQMAHRLVDEVDNPQPGTYSLIVDGSSKTDGAFALVDAVGPASALVTIGPWPDTAEGDLHIAGPIPEDVYRDSVKGRWFTDLKTAKRVARGKRVK